MNHAVLIGLLALAGSAAVQAQTPAPVEERGQALQQGQYRAGVAHRELERARFDAKLAEQDALNARDASAAAQKEAAARKRELDAAEKSLAAARVRLQAAQSAYDDAVRAVDAVPRPPAPAQNR
jgi:predicted lipid-binding transport protein (Tim44 family)